VLDRGWSAVRMGAIATAVGVSRQSLHAEFGTKDDLGDALVLREVSIFFDGMLERLEHHRGDLAGAVRDAGGYIVDAVRDNPLLQTILTRAPAQGDFSLLPLLTTRGEPLIGRLVLVDALAMRFREVRVRKNPECPVCGANPTIKELIDYDQFCGVRGEDAAPSAGAKIPEIRPEELKRRIDTGEDIFVLDVREPHEYQICNISGHLIPLGDLPKRVHELDSSREIVVHCKSGARSAKAVDFLRQSGFKRVSNLAGGILAWADRIDRSLPKY